MFRAAARRLWRSPGFLAGGIVVLTLSLGASSAILALMVDHFILSRPIRNIFSFYVVENRQSASLQWDDYTTLDLRDEFDVFPLSKQERFSLTSARGGTTTVMNGRIVSRGLFKALGVGAAAGFVAGSTESDGFVLTHAAWQRLFAGDKGVLGRIFKVGGQAKRLLGVLEERFYWWDQSEVFCFLPPDEKLSQVHLLLRAPNGFPPDAVQGQVRSLLTVGKAVNLTTTPLKDYFEASNLPVRRQVIFIAISVGSVLLVSLSSIVCIFLLRQHTFVPNYLIALSLGERPGRIYVAALLEPISVLGLASVLAIPLSLGTYFFARRAAVSLLNIQLSGMGEPVFCLAALVIPSAVLICSGQVWSTIKILRRSGFRQGNVVVAGAGMRRHWLSAIFFGQTALVFMVLSLGLLFGRTLSELSRVDWGFDADGVWLIGVPLSERHVRDGDDVTRLFRLADELDNLAGIDVAALARDPTDDSVVSYQTSLSETTPIPFVAIYRPVSARFFDLLDIRVVQGSTWKEQPGTTEPVIVISESLGKRHWPNRSPLGEQLKIESEPFTRTIIGVVSDVRPLSQLRYHAFRKTVYIPWRGQRGTRARLNPSILIRVKGDDQPNGKELKRFIDASFSTQPLQLKKFSDLIRKELAAPKFYSWLFYLIGGAGLVCGMLALFSLTSVSLSQRLHECAVRMALGASPLRLALLVCKGDLLLLVASLCLGFGLVSMGEDVFLGLFETVERFRLRELAITAGLMTISAVAAALLAVRKLFVGAPVDIIRERY